MQHLQVTSTRIMIKKIIYDCIFLVVYLPTSPIVSELEESNNDTHINFLPPAEDGISDLPHSDDSEID